MNEQIKLKQLVHELLSINFKIDYHSLEPISFFPFDPDHSIQSSQIAEDTFEIVWNSEDPVIEENFDHDPLLETFSNK